MFWVDNDHTDNFFLLNEKKHVVKTTTRVLVWILTGNSITEVLIKIFSEIWTLKPV